ncbi:C39 family peptidase [Noviherbaspirillum malthae]|uniref:C39 family peptidase n=1 Tax=Noviherbaspirillum malthae TaxID=1260987 RepID=UPI001E4B606D|nr:C39 family peptidase [Noviherbaspirillum malthae]
MITATLCQNESVKSTWRRLAPCRHRGRALAALMTACLLSTGQSFAQERQVVSLLEMRHQNVILQKWDLSCGAAALTTLLNYQHGESLTEKEVAVTLMNRPEYIDQPELIQIREGFSLLDLKRYAEMRGYKGVGLGKMEMKDLEAKAPLLVPINVRGYNHFVVFRGTRGNRVLLADPAWGNRTMLKDEFEQAWINYPTLGRVGFAVERKAPPHPTFHGLSASVEDFVMLR